MKSMRLNRGLLFWGLALITTGAVALAVELGYGDRDVVSGAWRLWPLLLVAFGVSLLASRTSFAPIGTLVSALVVGLIVGALFAAGPGFSFACGGQDPSTLATHGGQFSGDRARVQLDFDCGTLRVATAAGTGWRAEVGRNGGDQPTVSSDDADLTITSPGGGPFGGRERWEVTLPTDVTLDASIAPNAASSTLALTNAHFSRLAITPNAGDVTLDLSGAQVDDLSVSVNAGSAHIATDGATAVAGEISVNAGSISLCTASDGAVAITVTETNITFSHNLDETGLARSGDTWQTVNYPGAQHRVTLTVRGNVGSFSLNPEEGCT
jgi:hypothetical protein